MPDEILVKCENVSKKFCRSLKRSLWYGVQDICFELNPLCGGGDIVGADHFPELRKNEFWAVNDISFELKRGECLGLIGHNGAGKSTLLKMLNGLIKPDHGRITMTGRIGALIELSAGFNPILTGRENVYIYGSILGFSKKEIDRKYDDIVEFAELADFMEMPFRSYSSGMQVRLGFAVAVQMEPDVLIIDEVLAVGDLGFKMKSLNRINKLIENSAVIFVSHAMQFVSLICTEAMVINKGNIEYHGNNVGKGIDYYQNKFTANKTSVSGNGKAKISVIQLASGKKLSNDKEIFLIDYEDDLTILMDLHFDPSVKHPVIKIEIHNQDLRPVADCFSHFWNFEFSPKEINKISLKFPKLRLNGGIYSIIIGVRDIANGQVLTRIQNAAHFQVKTVYTSWAPVLLKGEWKEI